MTTKAVTIAGMIAELIETHMAKCDNEFPDHDDHGNLLPDGGNPDRVPHVISEAHDTKASIEQIITADQGDITLITLSLDDGTIFNVIVEEA